MIFNSESSVSGLRSLSYKYGAVFIICILNSLFVGRLIGYVVLPSAFSAIESMFGDGAVDIKYAFLILMNDIASYLLPILMYVIIFRSDMPVKRDIPSFHDESDYRRFPGETIILFIAGIWAALAGSYITGRISELLNYLFSVPETQQAFSDFMPQNAFQYTAFEIGSVIIAPVCEEIIYRHLLLRPLRKYGDLAAAIMTALIFGLAHFNFDQFLYASLFGFFLAIIAIRSDSVIPSIICHVANNLMVGISSYLPETLGSETADAIFASVGDVLSKVTVIIFYGGAVMLIAAIFLKLIRFRSASGMSGKKQLAVLFSNPFVLIGIAASLALAVYNLYI